MSSQEIDGELGSLLDLINQRPRVAGLSVEQRRKEATSMAAELRGAEEEGPVIGMSVMDRSITVPHGLVPTRVYEPRAAKERARPVVVYIHGGGFVVGTIDSYDTDCRRLAERLDATVVSIGYRLAPENPYPSGLADCFEVLRVLRREFNGVLGVAGDSAGGNLALAAALCYRRCLQGIDALMLLYPAVDPDAVGNKSYQANGSGYLLTADDMRFYYAAYLNDDVHRADELAAPSRATSFEGLPPTVLVSAGFDPLHDECRDLACRLVADEVEVHYLANPSLTHGFQQLVPRIPAARLALDRAYESFRGILERPAKSL